MFYTADILCMRKKGKLARIWLAATLSERSFKQTVGNKALLSIRIEAVGNEVIRALAENSGQRGTMRFSLYLASQLMYGMVKVHSYQISIYTAFLYRTQQLLAPPDFLHGKKRKNTSRGEDDVPREIDLPNALPLEEVFKNLQLRADIHLLPEADLETMKNFRTRAYVDSPTFGELTDEQIDLFLTDDDWLLQTGLDELKEPIRYGADDTNQRPISPPAPLEPENTPKRRGSRIIDVDTPTKKRRRNLGAELNAAAGQGRENPPIAPSTDFPADQEFDQPINIPIDFPAEQESDQRPNVPTDLPNVRPFDLPEVSRTNVPIDSVIPSSNRHENTTVREHDEIHLDSLELEITPRPRNRRRFRKILIDEHTTLLRTESARMIGNNLAYTRPKESDCIVPERGRLQDATALLNIPSTFYRTTHDDSLKYGFRYRRWAVDLMPSFQPRTIGPFSADDESMTAEAVRAADSRVPQLAGEISSGLGRGMGLESSSQNKTTDEPSAKTIQQPSIPEIMENDYEPQMTGPDFAGIPHEHISENITYPDTKSIGNDFQSNILPADSKAVTNVPMSDAETEDIDAFLPPKLKARSVVKKTSHEKQSPAEAIVTIIDSPTLVRTQESVQIEWSKPELLAELAVHWEQCPRGETVTLSTLIPFEHTNKLNAAVCFTTLLELHKDRIVNLVQEESYGEIYINKAAGEHSA